MFSRVTKSAITGRLLPVLFMACSGLWSVTAGGQALQDASRIVLENSLVRRVLEKEHQVWRTRSFSRADGSAELQVESEEFRILLMDGTKLGLEDYRAQGDPVTKKNGNNTIIEIAYVPGRELPPGAPQSVLVRYSLAEEPYLRKTLTLEMEEGEAVDRLEVERFTTGQACQLGGIGAPVFVGKSWFVGLEYPLGFTEYGNGLVSLAHYPGLAKKSAEKPQSWIVQSKTAVAGAGLQGDPLELTFSDYLDTIRLPSPMHVEVDAWMTLPQDVDTEGIIACFDAFKRNLDPYGIKVDSFMLGFKGFNYQSLFLMDERTFPQGYRGLSQALEEQGTRLAIWHSPVGTGMDFQWGLEQGFEEADGPYRHPVLDPSGTTGGYFCLAAPRFKAAMFKSVGQIIEESNPAGFEHDFIQSYCSAEGHGHLPTVRHGFEANVDAILELMDYQHQLQPEILVWPQSYRWLSPWWLMHANYIFMVTSDLGVDRSWPQISPREQEISSRDGDLYRMSREDRQQMPISSAITSAFTRNENTTMSYFQTSFKIANPGGDQETLREWSDTAMMVYGRGLQMIELYVSPSTMDSQLWQIVGEATRWGQENQGVLGKSVMVGGDPNRGEVYGYAHWKGDRGILCLRNPDVREQAVVVPFDKSVFHRGATDRPFRGRVVYPYVEDLPLQFRSGESILLPVPGYTVMVIELGPGHAPQITPADPVSRIQGQGRVDMNLRTTQGKLKVNVQVPDEAMDRCDLVLIARGPGHLPDFADVAVNGQPVKGRSASAGEPAVFPQIMINRRQDTLNPDWKIKGIDLKPFRGKKVEITGNISLTDVRAKVEAWIVADRPVPAPAVSQENLPPLFWKDFRRQSVRLLSYSVARVPFRHPAGWPDGPDPAGK